MEEQLKSAVGNQETGIDTEPTIGSDERNRSISRPYQAGIPHNLQQVEIDAPSGPTFVAAETSHQGLNEDVPFEKSEFISIMWIIKLILRSTIRFSL